jgi:hypothetical protein
MYFQHFKKKITGPYCLVHHGATIRKRMSENVCPKVQTKVSDHLHRDLRLDKNRPVRIYQKTTVKPVRSLSVKPNDKKIIKLRNGKANSFQIDDKQILLDI